jgi:hypothetical protein
VKLLLVILLAFSYVCLCYVAVIHLKKLRTKQVPLTFWLITLGPHGIVGWLGDVLLFNGILGTIAYLEFPHELTFSSRIQRHYLLKPDRRFTRWWAARLNEIDDSPHIHGPRT